MWASANGRFETGSFVHRFWRLNCGRDARPFPIALSGPSRQTGVEPQRPDAAPGESAPALIETWTRIALRILLRGIQRLRRLVWSITKPAIDGAHGIAVTPGGAIVLVKMRYARGWHLPGGGRKKGESARDNVLRELREEIGMTGYSDLQLARTTQDIRDFRRDTASVFIVWDVTYRPARWSLEIEEVMEADLARLPVDISLRALGWIASVRDVLEAAR